MTELDRFREAWREEVAARRRHEQESDVARQEATGPRVVSTDAAFRAERPKNVYINEHLTKTDRQALDAFERAVDCEHNGKMTDAVTHYREAFRLNEQVDKLYREKYYRNVKPAKAGSGAGAVGTKSITAARLDTESIVDMLNRVSLDGDQAQTSPEDDNRADGPCYLLALPDELLAHVLRHLAVRDMASFSRAVYSCKRLALLGYSREHIWRAVCERAFAHQHYSPDIVFPDGFNPDSLETTAARHYGNSYRRMYFERPRIRFNGVYISTCNYVRQGAGQSWYAPIHMVTYYRYLRFYEDGTCISLLTSAEPADVVPVFNRKTVGASRAGTRQQVVYTRDDGTVLSRPKHIVNGTWHFVDTDGTLLIETEGSVDRFTFYMKMSLVSSGHHRHNKIKWIKFWSVNRLTLNEAEFTLQHDKAYYFVRSKY